MDDAVAAALNTDPFAADVIDGQDGWERNYGGLKAVAPWLEDGPNPVPPGESRAEAPTAAGAKTPETADGPMPAPKPDKGPGALVAAALGVLILGGAALGLALKKGKKKK